MNLSMAGCDGDAVGPVTRRPLRLLLVDDNPVFLAAAQALLRSWPEVEVVGTAGNGREALARTADLGPDVVLTDMTMPGMNGLEVCRALGLTEGAPPAVLMTVFDGPEYRDAARRAGAAGFLTKSDLAAELLPLLRRLSVRTSQQGGGRPTPACVPTTPDSETDPEMSWLDQASFRPAR